MIAFNACLTVVLPLLLLLQVGRQPLLVTWQREDGQEPTQRTYPTPITPTALLQQLQVSTLAVC
jgi:hypothetical protein